MENASSTVKLAIDDDDAGTSSGLPPPLPAPPPAPAPLASVAAGQARSQKWAHDQNRKNMSFEKSGRATRTISEDSKNIRFRADDAPPRGARKRSHQKKLYDFHLSALGSSLGRRLTLTPEQIRKFNMNHLHQACASLTFLSAALRARPSLYNTIGGQQINPNNLVYTDHHHHPGRDGKGIGMSCVCGLLCRYPTVQTGPKTQIFGRIGFFGKSVTAVSTTVT
ncbi:unnamed protein product [Caenorhabditis brenneri]